MDKKIVALLDSNLRVIIPEFGAFIIRQKEPLVVVFSDQLKNNDGLLLDFIVKTENVELEVAEQGLSDYTSHALKVLDSGKLFTIEGLGILQKEKDGTISFTQEKDIITLDEPLSITKDDPKPTFNAEKQSVQEAVSYAQPEPLIPEKKPAETIRNLKDDKDADNPGGLRIPILPHQAAKWAIIILVANIAVFAFFSLKDRVSDKFRKNSEPVGISKTVLDQLADSVRAAVEDTSVVFTTGAPVNKENMKSETPGNLRYYIVAGCFRDEVNADELVRSLKKAGFDAEKFGKIGDLFAVSYGSYDDKEVAVKELARVREESHPDAWMTRF